MTAMEHLPASIPVLGIVRAGTVVVNTSKLGDTVRPYGPRR
jgi:hypothetical protein